MLKYFYSAVFICCTVVSHSQTKKYTSQNIHSHNDYKQTHPFYIAYNAQAGSMEADIFLKENNLPVAHQSNEIDASNTLESMYLQKIDSCINANHGFPYADKTKQLQLLIDLKTEGIPLMNELVKHLEKYPSIINNKNIIITITGIDHNFPNDNVFATYPNYIHLDGVLSEKYSESAQKKIVMYSDDFMK